MATPKAVVEHVTIGSKDYTGVLTENSFSGVQGNSLAELLIAQELGETVEVQVNPNVPVVRKKLTADERIQLATLTAKMEAARENAPRKAVIDVFRATA